MSLAEISTGNPNRQDVVLRGYLYAEGVVAQSAGGSVLVVQDGVQNALNVSFSQNGTTELAKLEVDYAAWNAGYAYPQGSATEYNGETWIKSAAGASVPGAVPSAPSGWTVQVAPAPLRGTNYTPFYSTTDSGGNTAAVVLTTANGASLQLAESAAGISSAAFKGSVLVGTDNAPATACPAAGGCLLEWDTQKILPPLPAPYNSQHLGWTELVNADGSGAPDAGGFDFFTGANGQAVPRWCGSLTTSAEALNVVSAIQTQMVLTEGIRLLASTLPGRDATFGVGTLVLGSATVITGASDPTALIFLQRTGAAGTPVGTLQVVAKTGANFTVESLDAAGAVVNGDVSSFDWWIVNPNWA